MSIIFLRANVDPWFFVCAVSCGGESAGLFLSDLACSPSAECWIVYLWGEIGKPSSKDGAAREGDSTPEEQSVSEKNCNVLWPNPTPSCWLRGWREEGRSPGTWQPVRAEKGKETDPLPESPEETQPLTLLDFSAVTLISDLWPPELWGHKLGLF